MSEIRIDSDFTDIYDFWQDTKSTDVLNRRSDSGMNRVEMFEYLKKHHFEIPLFDRVYNICRNCPGAWEGVDYEDQMLVVYMNLYSHRGEGKVLLHRDDALDFHPFHYASVYIHKDNKPMKEFPGVKSISRRVLGIGSRTFILYYTSNRDWRSNVGEGDVWTDNEVNKFAPRCIEDRFKNLADLPKGTKIYNLGHFHTCFMDDISDKIIANGTFLSDDDFSIERLGKRSEPTDKHPSIIIGHPLWAIDFVGPYFNYAVDFNTAPQLKGTGIQKFISSKEIYEEIRDTYFILKETK